MVIVQRLSLTVTRENNMIRIKIKVNKNMTTTSAMILAAGTASRMGRTKQLLDLGGAPLLQQVIQSVKSFPFKEIITVLGHDAEQIQNNVVTKDARCCWIVNEDYALGQSQSLKTGIEAIQTTHVMLFLGDQPFISKTTISAIYEKGKTMERDLSCPFVIRPVYHSIPGHPVFFGNVKQIDFSKLSSDQGAKSLIKQMDNYNEILVEDDEIIFDIDTPVV